MTSASHHTLTRRLSTAPGFLAGHVSSRDAPEIIYMWPDFTKPIQIAHQAKSN